MSNLKTLADTFRRTLEARGERLREKDSVKSISREIEDDLSALVSKKLFPFLKELAAVESVMAYANIVERLPDRRPPCHYNRGIQAWDRRIDGGDFRIYLRSCGRPSFWIYNELHANPVPRGWTPLEFNERSGRATPQGSDSTKYLEVYISSFVAPLKVDEFRDKVMERMEKLASMDPNRYSSYMGDNKTR